MPEHVLTPFSTPVDVEGSQVMQVGSWFVNYSLVFFEPLASFNVGRGLPEHVFALFSPEFIMEDFSRDVGPDSVLKSYFRKRFSKIAR